MGKVNLNTVEEILKYEETNGFVSFEKNRRHRGFEDEDRPKKSKNKKRKRKDKEL